MPNVSPEKVRTPAGSDSYALTVDLRLLGESVRSFVPVASTTERDAVASAMATAGRPATAANPLIVVRADAPSGAEVELTVNGTTWRTIASEATANVTTFGTGWSSTGSGHTPRVRRVGNQCFLYGAVTLSAGGSFTNLLTVPTEFRPPNGATRFIGTAAWNAAGATSGVRPIQMANGVVGLTAGYGVDGSGNVGAVVPLVGSWWMD